MSGVIATYGTTADNLYAARYADAAWAMVPKSNGVGFFVANGWLLQGTFEEWSRNSFFGQAGDIADEAGFRGHVEGVVQHMREKAALGREHHSRPCTTPWGTAQHTEIYGPGITAYSTASHGGFFLGPDTNMRVRPALRSSDGWYEEDCAWAAVAFTFPHLFTTLERDQSDRLIRNHHPDVFEEVHKVVLQPGESWEKDKRAFRACHAADWVVASAVTSSERPGFTEVFATIGDMHRRGEGRRFLVPSDEYVIGQFGFVVDAERHAALPEDASSSFIGYER